MRKIESLLGQCWRCHSSLEVKYCPPRKAYSQKNNWGYWTEKEENKEKYICNPCFRTLYYKEHLLFLDQVPSEQKRRLLAVYLSANLI